MIAEKMLNCNYMLQYMLCPVPSLNAPKITFMLPQKYHASVSNMLSETLKCFIENEN